MNIHVAPGTYVIAVSGGVDSMVLLDLLAKQADIILVVAHYDHGIRSDSQSDRELVRQIATGYNLPFVYKDGKLGPGVSEAVARSARYEFLKNVQQSHVAQAIITAHHQDDLLETAILNLLRGTGRKGLSSLQSSEGLLRPLLHMSKKDIKNYAIAHHIAWHEDSTNESDDYLRNYIRHAIVPKLGEAGRTKLLAFIQKAAATNPAIDALLLGDVQGHITLEGLDRKWFVTLPHAVANEVMASWLRSYNIREFTRPGIERLTVAAKVARPGSLSDINAAYLLEVGKTGIRIVSR